MKNNITPRAVIEAGYNGDIPVIERAWASSDPALRVAALGSFNRVGLVNHTQLITALRDNNPAVRRRAAELSPRVALAGLERTSVCDELQQLLTDDDSVAEVAAFALGEIGSQPPDNEDTANDDEFAQVGLAPELIDGLKSMALEHPDALCREQAVASLGALYTGKETILKALKDKATVRRRAVIALAPFDGPDVDAALETALDDRDWQVRQAAEDLLSSEEPEAQALVSDDEPD